MHNMNYGYFIGLTLGLISGCVGYGLKHLQNAADHRQFSEPRSAAHEPWLLDIEDVDHDVTNGVVPVKIDLSETQHHQQENVDNIYEKIRPAIANVLNHVERSKGEYQSGSVVSGQLYTASDVSAIAVHPPIRDGVLRVPVYVQQPGGGDLVRNERLKRTVDNSGDSAGTQLDTKFDGSDGRATDADTSGETGGHGSSKKQSIWEAHYWFFIIVLIFVCISVILLTVCLSCTLCKCPGRQQQQQHQPIKPLEQQQLVTPTQLSHGGKKPMEVQEEPLLAVAAAKPAMAQVPVYSAAPSSPLDEENGWIIPMDQLTQEERLQTEVPLTKF